MNRDSVKALMKCKHLTRTTLQTAPIELVSAMPLEGHPTRLPLSLVRCCGPTTTLVPGHTIQALYGVEIFRQEL